MDRLSPLGCPALMHSLAYRSPPRGLGTQAARCPVYSWRLGRRQLCKPMLPLKSK